MSRFCFPSLIELSHSAIEQSLKKTFFSFTKKKMDVRKEHPLLLIDGTCGNGHDSFFLCSLLSSMEKKESIPAKILSFDVQEQALSSAKSYIASQQNDNLLEYISFIHQGHEHLDSSIVQGSDIAIAMYNLGYLPRSDKKITTKEETTLISLSSVKEHLIAGGVLSVHAYAGHDGGDSELTAVNNWFCALPEKEWIVAKYLLCNKKHNPEALFLAEKL